jgi:hypothetical protein
VSVCRSQSNCTTKCQARRLSPSVGSSSACHPAFCSCCCCASVFWVRVSTAAVHAMAARRSHQLLKLPLYALPQHTCDTQQQVPGQSPQHKGAVKCCLIAGGKSELLVVTKKQYGSSSQDTCGCGGGPYPPDRQVRPNSLQNDPGNKMGTKQQKCKEATH